MLRDPPPNHYTWLTWWITEVILRICIPPAGAAASYAGECIWTLVCAGTARILHCFTQVGLWSGICMLELELWLSTSLRLVLVLASIESVHLVTMLANFASEAWCSLLGHWRAGPTRADHSASSSDAPHAESCRASFATWKPSHLGPDDEASTDDDYTIHDLARPSNEDEARRDPNRQAARYFDDKSSAA